MVDSGNHRIQVFTAKGEFVRMFGSHGDESGELYLPIGIAVVHNGLVYVSEYCTNSVSIFTCEGQFVTSFGKEGSSPGEFTDLANLVIDNGAFVHL